MLKQLSTTAYWLGLICAALAIVLRLAGAFGVFPHFGSGNPISYMTFFHGAILLLVVAIASGPCCCGAKP